MKLQFSFGNMGVGLAIMADPLERCSTPAIKYERTKERVKKKRSIKLRNALAVSLRPRAHSRKPDFLEKKNQKRK